MRHFLRRMGCPHPTTQFRHTTRPWSSLWQVLGITAFICLGFASEGLTQATLSPTSLTYYAVQGATNPPTQTITVSRTSSRTATLTASDNASWLTMSPSKTSMTKSVNLTVAVNTSGRGAGTYKATITIKIGTWWSRKVPVTLIISPTTSSQSSTTSTATLAWNAVTGTTISGYKIYIGEAPKLYTRTITVGSATSSIVNSLTVGRTYYFAVTAYNSAGESAPSNEASKTIQ
jgi:hypothetical protein